MARITVEDCVKKIDRFSLVILTAQRVREIEGGAPLHVPKENDKNPVIALREIAQGKLDFKKLENAFMRTFQKPQADDEWEEEVLDEDPLPDDAFLPYTEDELDSDEEDASEENDDDLAE